VKLGIEGKRALVFAATRGLGFSIARALADEGAQVAISGREQGTVTKASKLLRNCIGVAQDLREPHSGRQTVERAESALGGPIEILVLNGPGPTPLRAVEVTEESMRDAVELLLTAHVGAVRSALPHMVEQKWGRIVAVGSSSMIQPLRGMVLSNAGRAGLAYYLKTLATEVAGDGVTVNMLIPGRFATQRLRKVDEVRAARNRVSVDEVVREASQRIPVGRYGEPDEFGPLGAFLCSEAAGYLTGSMVRCDGGMIESI
jgi:3-oxoacyl-[acyl-carrier protein] reductase